MRIVWGSVWDRLGGGGFMAVWASFEGRLGVGLTSFGDSSWIVWGPFEGRVGVVCGETLIKPRPGGIRKIAGNRRPGPLWLDSAYLIVKHLSGQT